MIAKAALVFTALLFIQPGSAQTTNVFDWAHLWRVFDRGTAPPPDWISPGFDDSQWSERPGVFGYPQNENLIVSNAFVYTPLTKADNGTNRTAYYFRTRVSLPEQTTVTCSNLVDDGAIIYLDGAELVRFGMPTGAVEYATPARRQSDIVWHGVETFVVTNLAAGEHVFAVELHQGGSNNSSDAIFGMKAVANAIIIEDPPRPPLITREPQDQTVLPGARATFSVEVSGTAPLRYQWHTNGVPIANVDSPTYTTELTKVTMDGIRVHVVVTNLVGTARSRDAILRVRDDKTGPKLIAVRLGAGGSGNDVELKFDRIVQRATATNVNNYVFHQLGTTNRITVAATVYGVSRMLLRPETSLGVPGAQWVLVVNNVTDTGGVPIAPNSKIAIPHGLPATLSMAHVWRYNDASVDLGTAWREVAYIEDESWQSGPAVFWRDTTAPGVPCGGGTAQTSLQGPRQTYYFRTTLDLEVLPNPTNAVLELTHFVDDGAVFYFNGLEVHRYNMPPGAVDYATFAYLHGEPTCVTTNITLTNYVHGTNVLAAEVHQSGFDSTSDAAFGVVARITITSVPILPALTITRTADTIVVTWLGEDRRLESASAIEGPWAEIETEQNEYRIAVSAAPKFFRLVTP